MKRALELLDEFRDIVQGKPCFEITEVTDRCLEAVPASGDASARQAAAQRLVDDLSERPASAARFRLEVGRYIIVQGEGRAHSLMLYMRHHDVKPYSPCRGARIVVYHRGTL
jgi:hypothetical protein